jgi:hypothetical protein
MKSISSFNVLKLDAALALGAHFLTPDATRRHSPMS